MPLYTRSSRLTVVSLVLVLAAAGALLGQSAAPAPATQAAPAPSTPPSTAVLSSDGRRSVWPSEDGRSVWSALRKAPGAAWDPAVRLLTIRGTVRNLVFSPDNARIAFENPRSLTGGRAGGAAPAPQDTWAFIVVFDITKRTIAYVDPQFSIDSAPSWSKDG